MRVHTEKYQMYNQMSGRRRLTHEETRQRIGNILGVGRSHQQDADSSESDA